MIKSFYQYVQMVSEAGPPTPPPPPPGGDVNAPPDPNAPGGAPPPGGDPMAGGMGGMGGGGGMGGDPMGGGAGAGGGTPAPKAAINVTTVWDAIRGVLGKHAERQEGVRKPHHKSDDDQEKQKSKLKSLMQ